MDLILDFIQSFDFESFDFLGLLNTLIGLIKSLLGGFTDGGEV